MKKSERLKTCLPDRQAKRKNNYKCFLLANVLTLFFVVVFLLPTGGQIALAESNSFDFNQRSAYSEPFSKLIEFLNDKKNELEKYDGDFLSAKAFFIDNGLRGSKSVADEAAFNPDVSSFLASVLGSAKDAMKNIFDSAKSFVFPGIGQNDFEYQSSSEEEVAQEIETLKQQYEEAIKEASALKEKFISIQSEIGKIKAGGVIIKEPVIEQRVVEKTVEKIVSGLSQEDLFSALSYLKSEINNLNTSFTNQINNLSSNTSRQTADVYNVVSLTNRIDSLYGTNLSSITVSGVSGLTDADIPDGITASSYLPLIGGTISGDLTVIGNATLGVITLQNATAGYFTATSTSQASIFPYASTTALTVSGNSYLGTVSSGIWNGTALTDAYISSAATWNNKWDLASSTIPVSKGGTGQNLSASSGLVNFYSGTASAIATSSLGLLTTNVAEGTNQYWTNDRFDTRLSATTTLPNLTTLLGLTNATTTGITSTNSWLGTIRSGTWNGTVIGNIYGGTGIDSSALTGLAQIVSGTWSASSTLSAAYGGTGWNSLQANTVLLGNGSGRLATTTAGTAGNVLALLNGVPTWTATTTLSDITGTLSVAKGGTGQTSFGQGWLNSDGTTFTSSTSPTVAYLTATSTTATSTFAGGMNVAGTAGLTVLQNGKVGIGTTSPNTKLYVQGSSDLTQFIVQANSTQSNTNPLIKLVKSDGTELARFHSDNPDNLFIGTNAGRVNNVSGVGSEGLYNTFFGPQTGYSNTTGYSNNAQGQIALYSNTTGYRNIAVGNSALYSNDVGYQNTAVGRAAAYSNTSGQSNVAVGNSTFYFNTIGSSNTALGTQALAFNVTGSSTTAIGYQAGYGVSGNSFQNATLLGYKAGFGLTTGSNNILLGYQAGDNLTSGASNIVLGYNIDAPSPTSANTLNIGNLIFGTGVDGTGTTLSSGNIGIGTTSPYAKLSVVGQTVAEYFTATSTTASTFPYASSTALTISGNSYLGTVASGLWNGTALTDAYISSAATWNNKWDLASSTIPVSKGGTGQTSFGQGWLHSDGTTLTSSTSPTVAYLTATSTTATSTFAGGMNVAGTAGLTVLQNGKVGIGTTSPVGGLHILNQGAMTDRTSIDLDTTSGDFRRRTLRFLTGNSLRWAIDVDNANETGSNNGSQFGINRYDDSGSYLSTPFFIKRNNEYIRLGTTGGRVMIGGDVLSAPANMLSVVGNMAIGANYGQNNASPSSGLVVEGNIGIGTTSPYAKLSVVGDTALDSMFINFASSTASSLTLNYLKSATSTIPSNTNYAWSIATSTTASPIFSISTLGSGANVNATTTINGGFNLDNGAILYDYSSGITTINSLEAGPMSFDDNAGIVSWMDMAITSASAVNTKHSYTAQIDSNPILTVYGESDGSGAAKNLRVGIGTTSPLNSLTIHNATTTADADLGFTATSTNLASWYNWTMGIDISDGGKFKIASSTALGASDRLVIDGNGNVGIGTTSPWRTLSVTGTVGFSSSLSATTTNANDVCIDVVTFEITRRTTDCSGASSLRYKQNVEKLSYGLADLMKLNPVSFQYTDAFAPTDRARKIGFIAEEVALLIPEVVAYDDLGRPDSLDYPKITSLLAKAIQELNIKISDLQANASVSSGTGTDGLFSWIVNKFMTALGISFGQDTIKAKNICVGETCVTEDQFKAVFGGQSSASLQSSSISNGEPSSSSPASSSSSAGSSANSSSEQTTSSSEASSSSASSEAVSSSQSSSSSSESSSVQSSTSSEASSQAESSSEASQSSFSSENGN